MTMLKYPWKRYWCPFDKPLSLDEHGFLPDPEGEVSKYSNSHVVTLESSEGTHCLILLGEPGIGKSTALADEIVRLQEFLPDPKAQLLILDLNEYGEGSHFIKDLFESQLYSKWLAGDHDLYLFLDSMDEAKLQIPQVFNIMKNRLKKLESELPRLYLRIACRTADWSDGLGKSLHDLFDEDEFRVLELTPLRHKDVEEAAAISGIDSTAFINTVFAKEAIPFATKPVTLAFLINSYRATGYLSSSKLQLYEDGCYELCKELNDSRIVKSTVGGMGQLSFAERLTVASRIAAVMIFCQKSFVATEQAKYSDVEEGVRVNELTDYSDYVGQALIEIKEPKLLETFGTALFVSRGSNRFGFSHKTYAEFLASRYLQINKIDAKQIIAILEHPGDPERRIVPQLYETASWIASWNKDILKLLAVKEPKVLLMGDPTVFSDDDKRYIVDCFLTQLENAAEMPSSDLRHFYGKLAHPTIGDQLSSWIRDKSKSEIARFEAVRFAGNCGASDLQDLFVEVALDQSEKVRIRADAAGALSNFGDNDNRKPLLPLATGVAGDDPEDDMKAEALRALWPAIITAEKLFDILTPPKVDHHWGSYARFIGWELAQSLKTQDLPFALRWVEKNASSESYVLKILADNIIVQAWQALGNEEVLQALAKACVALFRNYRSILSTDSVLKDKTALLEDAADRRIVLKAIVETEEAEVHTIVYYGRLVKPDDFIWLMSRAEDSDSPNVRAIWADLAITVFQAENPNHVEKVLDSIPRCKEISDEFTPIIQPVRLDSQLAQRMKQLQKLDSANSAKPTATTAPTLEERVESILKRVETGEVDAWAILPLNLAIEEVSDHDNYQHGPDITKFVGWLKANGDTKHRVIQTAVKYLKAGKPDPDNWLGKNQFHLSDLAPYQAFYLLWQLLPSELTAFNEDVWRRWASYFLCPVIIDEDREKHLELMSEAYKHASDEFIEALKTIVLHEAITKHGIFIFDRIEKCSEGALCDMLFKLLPDFEVDPTPWRQVLSVLLIRSYGPAIDLAHSLLVIPLSTSKHDRSLARDAFATMFYNRLDTSWVEIKALLDKEPGFAKEAIEHFAAVYRFDSMRFLSQLSDIQMAELYIRFSRLFPHSEDPRYDGVYHPSGDDHAREIRDAILRFLTEKGTVESYNAVLVIKESLPDLEFLTYYLIEAKKKTLQKSWISMEVSDFLRFIHSPRGVVVRTATNLQDLIIDKLRDLERELQGETPAAPFLWDEQTDHTWRPKGEEFFSDYVKRFLERELNDGNIVCAREVQIRRRMGVNPGANPGEDLDILVMAVVPEFGPIKVILEVKGCWNGELKTAMEGQLVDRYLRDNQCQHGIYLVGWFGCEQWDTEDWRAAVNRSMSIDSATKLFDEQAFDLSNDTRVIKSFVMNTALR